MIFRHLRFLCMAPQRKREYLKTNRNKTTYDGFGGNDMYYSNGNYEAFARPEKWPSNGSKSAYLVGSGLASLGGGLLPGAGWPDEGGTSISWRS